MNIQRQPSAIIRQVTTGGAMAGPRVEAELKMPVGAPRSRTLYQLRTTRAPSGNWGDSPMPRNTRVQTNWPMVLTKPTATWASDHRITPMPSSQRGPRRSIIAPTGNWHSA